MATPTECAGLVLDGHLCNTCGTNTSERIVLSSWSVLSGSYMTGTGDGGNETGTGYTELHVTEDTADYGDETVRIAFM